MLKWILGIAAGLVWCVLAFVVTWYVTFPSQAVIDRLAYEVQEGSDGEYALTAGSASPWWAGVSLSDVVLMSVDETGKGTPILLADSVSARTAVGSVIGGGLPVHAVIDVGGSPIVLDAELDRSQNPPALQRIDAEAPELTVAAVSAMLEPLGARMSGEGNLDVMVDLEIGKKADDHDGRMKITGRDLKLSLVVPDPLSGGDFEIDDMDVDEIELVMDVKNGRAELRRGKIVSSLGTFDVDLALTLNDRFNRSRMSGTMVMSDLGGDLATFEPAFAAAKWDDGKYHYRISCGLNRLSGGCIRPERQRTSRPTPRAPSAVPDVDVERLQDRMERNRNRSVPTPSERGSATRSNARRPGGGANANDDLPDDELDDEEDLDDEEFIDEEDDGSGPVRRDIDLVEPPNGMPDPRLDEEALLPPR